MSILSVSFYGLLFSLALAVNGSTIRSFCQYPTSELCKMHRRNNFNRYFTVTDRNPPVHLNPVEDPLLMRTFDEIQILRSQLEAYSNALTPRLARNNGNLPRCINLGDDSCNNGSIPGSGKDDDFLIGGGNPGKRSQSNGFENDCRNLGDDGCLNGSLSGSGKADDFRNDSESPEK